MILIVTTNPIIPQIPSIAEKRALAGTGIQPPGANNPFITTEDRIINRADNITVSTAGTYPVYTVPTGKVFHPLGIRLIVTTATGLNLFPAITTKTSGGATIWNAVTLTNAAVHKYFSLGDVAGPPAHDFPTAGETIDLISAGVALGTLIVNARVIGWLEDA